MLSFQAIDEVALALEVPATGPIECHQGPKGPGSVPYFLDFLASARAKTIDLISLPFSKTIDSINSPISKTIDSINFPISKTIDSMST